MNYKMMGRIFAEILALEAFFMLPPLFISVYDGVDVAAKAFLYTIGILIAVSAFLWLICRKAKRGFYAQEGIVCVGLGWIFLSLFGALPFFISGEIPFYIDAFFEMVSGFTTTGASIVPFVEDLSRGILYWRSFSHWLGGMGVLVFLLAVVPGARKTGGTGLYLQGGAWEQIHWTKEDATGPFSLTAADGTPLTVAPGKSFIAIWGGYYGQSLSLTAADGSAQTLPEKPALLESGVPDDAAAAAEAELRGAQERIDAQAAVDQANADLAEAQSALEQAQTALDADSENADLLAARDAAQARVDELNQTIAEKQAILDAAPAETPAPEAPAEEEQPAE